MDATAIFALVAGSATAGGAVASAIFTFKSNASTVQNNVIEAQRIEIELLEKRVSTCETLHRENLSEMGKMQGSMLTLEHVLQNRDPKMQQTMEQICGFMEQLTVKLLKS